MPKPDIDIKTAQQLMAQLESVPPVEEVEEMAKPSFFKDLIAEMIGDIPAAFTGGLGYGAKLGLPLLRTAADWATMGLSPAISRLGRRGISAIRDILETAFTKQPPMREIRFSTAPFAEGHPYRETALVPVRPQPMRPRALLSPAPSTPLPPHLGGPAGYLKRGKYTSSELEPSGQIFYASPSSLDAETLQAIQIASELSPLAKIIGTLR